MQRDKEQTRKKILEATGRLLSQKGFRSLGANAIAKEAKISKVLIYRYYGGLPQLLKAFAEEGGFWPSATELLGGETNPRRIANSEQFSVTLLVNYLKELRRRKLTQEIMRWGLSEKNKLFRQLVEVREKQKTEIWGALPIDSSKYHEIDFGAATALLHAGITYMVLQAKTAEEYMGIDLHSNYGWRRLEKAIDALMRGYFAQYSAKPGTK